MVNSIEARNASDRDADQSRLGSVDCQFGGPRPRIIANGVESRVGLQRPWGWVVRRSVVFVHGTGVRAASFSRTFTEVKSQMRRLRPGTEIRPCLWGDAEGAKLALGGASIPQYTSSEDTPANDDRDIAVWAILYDDPGYELRLMGLRAPRSTGLSRGAPPHQVHVAALRRYTPSPQVITAFAASGLLDELEEALHRMANCAELNEAAATAGPDGYELRQAFNRAIVAAAVGASVNRGNDAPDGAIRDGLLSALGSDLHADGRPLPDGLRRAAAMPAVLAASWQAQRRRGPITDRIVRTVGDILRYQARGQGIRNLVKRTIEHAPGDAITVIAHSLGGVACVDLLVLEKIDRVDELITVGSQAPFFYEIGALASLEHPDPLPPHFNARWLNIYDRRDLLSYTAGAVFAGRAHDECVDSKQPFPYSHSAYWSNREVWSAVGSWLS